MEAVLMYVEFLSRWTVLLYIGYLQYQIRISDRA